MEKVRMMNLIDKKFQLQREKNMIKWFRKMGKSKKKKTINWKIVNITTSNK